MLSSQGKDSRLWGSMALLIADSTSDPLSNQESRTIDQPSETIARALPVIYSSLELITSPLSSSESAWQPSSGYRFTPLRNGDSDRRANTGMASAKSR